MKRILLIGLATAGAVLVVFFLTSHRIDQRHIETTAIILCKAGQQAVYEALSQYRRRNGQLPSDLSLLAEEGYVDDKVLHCPMLLRGASAEQYCYYPDSFGDSRSILLSDGIGSHTGEKLFRNISVVVVTMGDGTVWCMSSPEDVILHQ